LPGDDPSAVISSKMVRKKMALACAKTKLCMQYMRGVCDKGGACGFAHCQEELKPLPDFARTKLCPELERSGVCNNPKCRYAHGEGELRAGRPFSTGLSLRTAPALPPAAARQGTPASTVPVGSGFSYDASPLPVPFALVAPSPFFGHVAPVAFYGGGRLQASRVAAWPPLNLQGGSLDSAAGQLPCMSVLSTNDESDDEPEPGGLLYRQGNWQSELSNASTDDASPRPCMKPRMVHNMPVKTRAPDLHCAKICAADCPSLSKATIFDLRSAHSVASDFSAELLVKNTFLTLDIPEPLKRPRRPHSAPARPQNTLDACFSWYSEGFKTTGAAEGDVLGTVVTATAAAEATEEEAAAVKGEAVVAAKAPEAEEETTVAKVGESLRGGQWGF